MLEQLAFLAVGPAVLFISIWHQRWRCRGLALRARIDSALRDAHGGETFVAIEVAPSFAWRRGRVVLSVPADWNWLVRDAWDQVVAELPANYDLVIRGAQRGKT